MPFTYVFPFYFENPAGNFVIWVNNTDVTGNVLLGASFTNSFSEVATLNISFKSDVNVSLDDVIKIYDINLNTFLFTGVVKELTRRELLYNYFVKDCIVHDYTRKVYDVDDGVTGTFAGTEKAILIQLFNTYCPYIYTGTFLDTGGTTSITVANVSLKEAIEELKKVSSLTYPAWWVDDLLELHYGAMGGFAAASFNLSNTPNYVTTFPYSSFEYTDENISTSATKSGGSLKILKSGLHSGQTISIVNSVLSINTTYLITRISARLISTFNSSIQWEYTVSFQTYASAVSLFTGYGFDTIGGRLTNVPIPRSPYQPANKKYVDDNDALYLPLAGGTMSGAIAMGSNKITGLAAATTAGDAVRYEQIPSGVSNVVWKDTDEYSYIEGTGTTAWTDLDLTAKTSAIAKIAYLMVWVYPNTIMDATLGYSDNVWGSVRKKGTDPVFPLEQRNYRMLTSTGSAVLLSGTYGLCGMDTGQVVQYKVIDNYSRGWKLWIDVLGYIE